MTQLTQFLTLPWTWDLRQDEDGSWVVTIAELPDFFAAGSNPGEAALNAREALTSHLSGYMASGTPIPTPTPKASNRSMTGVDEMRAQLVPAA